MKSDQQSKPLETPGEPVKKKSKKSDAKGESETFKKTGSQASLSKTESETMTLKKASSQASLSKTESETKKLKKAGSQASLSNKAVDAKTTDMEFAGLAKTPSAGAKVPGEPVSENPSASSSKGTGAQDDEVDLTQQFLVGGDLLQKSLSKSQGSNKERFLGASLIVQGIALKKFKMAIAAEQPEGSAPLSSCYAAVLGESTCKQYRTSKKSLAGMVIGNILESETAFWAQAQNQLGSKKVLAIFVSDQFTGSLEHAPGSLIGSHTIYSIINIRNTAVLFPRFC